MVKIPQKFVGLHSHSTFSVSDALGLPQEHIEYALKNGSDALALTDHGNLNGFSHQQNKLKELESKGIHFKGIPGQEFYFVDSLSHWRTLKEEKERQAILEREAKKATKQKKKKEEDEEDSIVEEIGNELSSTEKELLEIAGQAPDAEESANVVENEEESKNQRWNDPIKQRNHLVILPKNNAGLKAIFRLTSEAYQNGFYKFPRIDFDLLKKYANGNLVATSACVSGEALLETNYGILKLKEVVERVNTGERIFVLSYNETQKRLCFEEVLNGRLTKKKAKVLKITLQNGDTIKVTPDHMLLTDKGWLKAEELKKYPGIKILTSHA